MAELGLDQGAQLRGAGLNTDWSLSHTRHSLHPHQELWAVDRLQVQEFMLSFLRDPLREIEEPYFCLDEVSPTFHPFCQRE